MIVIDFMNVFYNRDPSADNFSAQLFRLIAKADRDNMNKLAKGFPLHVDLYKWWTIQCTMPTKQEIQDKISKLQKEYGKS